MEMTHGANFLTLPDEIWSHILMFLGPEDLLSLESVSGRFVRLTFDKSVLHVVKFRSDHRVQTSAVRDFFRDARPLAISVLDFSNCVWIASSLLEQCIGKCHNLVALKVVNCRLSVVAMIKLLARLKHLTSLEWSVFSIAQSSISAIQKLDHRGSLQALKLQDMYVELLESTVHVDVMIWILPFCSQLARLHLHVVGTSIAPYNRVPSPVDLGTLSKLETFTYTTDIVRGRCPYATRSPIIESAELWKIVFGQAKDLIRTFCLYATVCGNATVRLRPSRACSCVQMSDLLRGLNTSSDIDQLCVTIESPTYLFRAALLDHWGKIRSLTLLSPVPINQPTFPPGIDLSYGGPFCSLLQRCSNLRELNMTRFHFSADFNCCRVLAESSLSHLAVLALPACALISFGGPPPLQHFASCSLIELDVRRSIPTAHSICSSCSDPRTCTPEDLAPVAKMSSLRRLTLCNLGNVHSLAFLEGCQAQEMRICNLGRKGLCPYVHGLSGILRENRHLVSLKLEHPALPLASRVLWDALGYAVCLRRLCLVSFSHNDVLDVVDVFAMINKLNQLRALHVHTSAIGVKAFNGKLREALRLSGRDSEFRLHVDSAEVLDLDPDTVFSSEQSMLCRTSNFVGLAKPRNRDVCDL